MRVDQSRQDRGLAQVNDSSSRRNLDLALRSHLGDSLAQKKHNLVRQHLAILAVKQAARADRDNFGSGRAFIGANIGWPHARPRAHPSPWSLLPRSLGGLGAKPLRHTQHAEHRHQQRCVSHTKPPAEILTSTVGETSSATKTLSSTTGTPRPGGAKGGD